MKTQFKKIRVKGSISLGHERELIQAPVAQDDPHMVFDGAGPSHEFDATNQPDDNKLGHELEYRLADNNIGELRISDDGMVTSFGIFGAPGSGKTVMLMHLLEQVFAHERDNDKRRYGALILDPKAALVEDITEMAKRTGRFDDLRVIGDGSELNVIDCSLDERVAQPREAQPVARRALAGHAGSTHRFAVPGIQWRTRNPAYRTRAQGTHR